MKTEWNYTGLATAYLKRPDYADVAIDAVVNIAGLGPADRVCDVGAGVAHLTMMLDARGLVVDAVEPNDDMRAVGSTRTDGLEHVTWYEGVGEATGRPSGAYGLVSFGSSFNVCDRPAALQEAARLLRTHGWFCCMWNHRDLDDPVQRAIEDIIRSHIPAYEYGARREDQRSIVDGSGLFGPSIYLNAGVRHEQTVSECVEAWRSHATLARQAGDDFPQIVDEIEEFLTASANATVSVPYSTEVWLAQLA